AAFAHTLVDHHAPGRIGVGVALAAAALFGGAGLVVHQHRHAGVVAQFAHDGVKLVAMAHRHAGSQRGHALVLFGLVGHHHDFLDALGSHLARDHRHIDGAIHRLAARHGHRIVEQYFVSDGHLGRHGGAYGQQAGMVVRAIAQVGKDVLLVDRKSVV